jgi:23S rRNA pseudouridine1911/1915/1917 synthase
MSDQASPPITRSWPVTEEQASIRLDAFVRRCLAHLSRRQVEDAIRDKLFRINNRVGRKGDKLSPGDWVIFNGVESWLLTAPFPQTELRAPIVYEDESVIVVDKPAGMATHGFSGQNQDTLANLLAAQRPDLLGVGRNRWEPGLVHRLDRETSGLVLVAKSQAAFDALRLQFRRRQVKKKYSALVWGITAAQGSVSYPIIHDARDRRRMRAIITKSSKSRGSKSPKSWSALTRFRKLCHGGGLSLLEIEMETGVTHQIRVHLAAIGHPIVGDLLYGRKDRERFGLDRHFLHACGLEFYHPQDQRMIKMESELPSELKAVARHLRAAR